MRPAFGYHQGMVTKVETSALISRLMLAGWTRSALADALGVDYDTVLRWGTGKGAPANSKLVMNALESLLTVKPPPRRRQNGARGNARP